ncbi:MAG: hypothetical protein ACI85K_002033 [Hyphomicrobiaceae bacterium]|jgi:hypothetical protein
MQSYLRALSAEILKYRRTMALWLALGIPTLITGIAWIVLTQSKMATADTDSRWSVLAGFVVQSWSTTCLHIGGAILIGMLWGLEHNSNQLKHVLAQPVSRHAMFWAKTTGILGLIALGTLLLCTLSSLVAIAVGIGPVRWEITFEGPFRAYLGWLPTMAMVSWVAQRFSSFALPLILGVIGVIVGTIVTMSEEYWSFVPWTWSMLAANGSDDVPNQAVALALSCGTLTLIGSWLHFWKADTPS